MPWAVIWVAMIVLTFAILVLTTPMCSKCTWNGRLEWFEHGQGRRWHCLECDTKGTKDEAIMLLGVILRWPRRVWKLAVTAIYNRLEAHYESLPVCPKCRIGRGYPQAAMSSPDGVVAVATIPWLHCDNCDHNWPMEG